MPRALIVFGTRPEAIKMCPLVKEMKSRSDEFETVLCVTGQHRQMLDQVLNTFCIEADYDLDVMSASQSLFDITIRILQQMGDVIRRVKPDLVLVHGDTTTSFATALAAFYERVPIGHVEAGLRTYNLQSPWPEEFNRQGVDIFADWLFAPTSTARENLIREGKPANRIFVTGNTGIDALKTTVTPEYTNEYLDWASDSRLALITAHRRENLGVPMHQMFRAIRRVLEEVPNLKAIYPIHLNPEVRTIAEEELLPNDRVRLIEPLDVVDFHNFMKASYLILTDSGGIQEEAPALGKPVLVMRDTTERPEGVKAGTLRIVGTDEEAIYSAFRQLLSDKDAYAAMAEATNPYGDGFASRRIADILAGRSCEDFPG